MARDVWAGPGVCDTRRMNDVAARLVMPYRVAVTG
jgi:hypothetical protein